MSVFSLGKLELGAESTADEVPLVPVENLRNTHIAAFSALLYIVVMGMVNSYSAPATADMKEPGSRFIDVTPDEITWIASLPLFTSIVGNCVSGYVTQKLGRKAVMMYTSVSYLSSWLIIAYAPSVAVIYVGRLVSGFCAGICCVAVPAYVVEIAPTKIRGLLSSGFQVAFTLGVFLTMALGIKLRWSWIAISGAVIVACAASLMVFMPESPQWLVRESRKAEALKGLKFLRGKRSDSQKELEDISADLSQQQFSKISMKEFLSPALYKPLAIAISLMFFQQASGINALMAYTVDIFQHTGSSIPPRVASTIVAAVQVLSTMLSSVLVDKSGRRRLYIISAVCVTAALLTLGLYSYFAKQYNIDLHIYGWIPLASFVVYVFSFSLGLGPIPFVMTPELVPLRSRSLVIAIASVSSSFFAFIVTKVFEDMRFHLNMYGLYWTYCGFSFICILFGSFLLPETKGLSIQEIHDSFSSSKN